MKQNISIEVEIKRNDFSFMVKVLIISSSVPYCRAGEEFNFLISFNDSIF